MFRETVLTTLTLFVTLQIVTTNVRAQECAPPAITANSKSNNIFTPDQEMVLGDLIHQSMSGDLRFIRDQELENYLNELGQKLVKHLPPTGLKFQFHIVDLPEANAFNIPGGYVFVSRKLIGFVNNEDELVGVLAHELGHAAVRHAITDFSSQLKQILNVTEVGDEKDITQKYNLVLERWRTKNVSRSAGHESSQQLEADRIGLFAMVAAGYDPNAFTAFFDRLAETKGKTGSWFSDVFGKSRPEQKRLREMIKVTEQLPAQCRENRQTAVSQQFLTWQANVVSHKERARNEQLNGLLWKKQLNPGLRSDISHFAFSPDGNLILAQDDFAITVLKRDPLEVQFQIVAPEARDATFTPDSKFVVFGTDTLRFEKWSVAEKQAVEVREMVVRRDCWEHEFSPDGKFLACIDFGLNLNVLNTQNGKRVWLKEKIYELNFFELVAWTNDMSRENASENKTGFFRIEFSPDGGTLAVSRSSRFRFKFKIDSMTMDESENTLIALDLASLKQISTGGDLKKVTKRAFVFLDSKRILGMASDKLEDSGVFSFPEGKRISKFSFGAEELILTADPNYLIVKPLSNAKLGIFDVSLNSIVNGMNKTDTSVWKNYIVFEGTSGKLVLADFHFNPEKKLIQIGETKTIDIPPAAIGNLNVAEVSDNFEWLAISSKTRGGVWSLSTGERKLHLRGFKGAVMGNDGGGIGDFPKHDDMNHSLALLNPIEGTIQPVREVPETGARQFGRFVLIRESLKEPKKPVASSTNKPDNTKNSSESKSEESTLSRDVRMSLRDVVSDKVVWTQEFNGQAPSYYFDKFSGRLILYWQLGSSAGKDRLKNDAVLAARAQKMGNKDDDYLMEIVDAFETKTIGTILLETGEGSFGISSAYSEGNWLILHDPKNRILALTISDGELQQRFFGNSAAINPRRQQIAVENYPGELSIYNLGTGKREARLIVGSEIAFLTFSVDGSRLFVLTENQVAYAFDTNKLVLKEGPIAVR